MSQRRSKPQAWVPRPEQKVDPQMNSRKDFQRAANLCGAIKDRDARATTTTVFLGYFRGDNPRFDADRFIAWVDKVHADLFDAPVVNATYSNSEALSYGVRCAVCGGFETACHCPDTV